MICLNGLTMMMIEIKKIECRICDIFVGSYLHLKHTHTTFMVNFSITVQFNTMLDFRHEGARWGEGGGGEGGGGGGAG